MAIGWQPRLTALLLLLLFQIINIASDIVFFRTKVNLSPTNPENEPPEQNSGPSLDASLTSKAKRLLMKADISRVLIPLLFTTLSVVIVSVLFSGASDTYRATENACSTKPDADISGVGVRASIWGQIAMLILISSSGHLHKKETAIKEVAGGLILTHVSLAIAIIVQMYKKTLTSVDAAIGAVILDAQNIALLIPVTAKQTLAARWQVLILIPAQILGLVFLPVLVVKFTKGGFASQDCKCLTIFWWSRLSDCNAFSGNELSLFWIYYTLRWMMWIHSSFHSMYNAEWFHRSEKEGRIPILNRDGTKPKTGRDKFVALALELRDPNRRVTKATIQAGLMYRQYSATISVSHTACALYSLTSMVVAEVTIGKYNLQPSSNANSIGQIIAVVVSLATLLRVIWSFQSLYNDAENSSFPDFIFSMLSRSRSSCCFGSDVEEAGEDPASILSRPDEEQPGRLSDTDSGHDGSGGSLPPQTPARSSQSSHAAVGPPDQYLGPNPGSPHPSNSRVSSDSTNLPKTQPHLPLGQNGQAQRLPPNRAVPQPKRADSYGPAYRFEFRQPFHLDAVKQLFLPTVTQYLEVRKKAKATTPMSEHPVSLSTKLPKADQPMACTPSQQSQQHTSREKALPSPLVVEVPHLAGASTTAIDLHPVMISDKRPDLIGIDMTPKTDKPDLPGPPGKGHEREVFEPRIATHDLITPVPAPNLSRPDTHKPTIAQKPEEQQPASLHSSAYSEKEKTPESPKIDKSSTAPLLILGDGPMFPADSFLSNHERTKMGLKLKTEYPGIANQSKGGGESQDPNVQTEKGRASALSIVTDDTESNLAVPQTIGQSAKSIEPVDEAFAKFKDAKNVVANPLQEAPVPTGSRPWNILADFRSDFPPHESLKLEPTQSSPSDMKLFAWRRRRRMQAILRWNFVLHELGILSKYLSGGQGSVGDTTETAVPMWETPRKGLPIDDLMCKTVLHWQARSRVPRSGCPGRVGVCSKSRVVWVDFWQFYIHYDMEHEIMGRPVECYECRETDTTSLPQIDYDNGYMLARHIWSKHLHREKFRDPSLPRMAKANQAKGKLAEAKQAKGKSAESSKMAQDSQATTEIQTSSSEKKSGPLEKRSIVNTRASSKKQGKLRAPEPADTDKLDNAEGRLCIPYSSTPERREWLSEWSQQYLDLPPIGFSLRAAPNPPLDSNKVEEIRTEPSDADDWTGEQVTRS